MKEKDMKCWCQAINWNKVIEEYPDQARVRDWHNCHIDDKISQHNFREVM